MMPERFDVLLGNVYIVALAMILWAYALYCRWQALRHRAPGTGEAVVTTLRFPPLAARGAAYRKRFYWALALGLVTLLVGFVSPPFE